MNTIKIDALYTYPLKSAKAIPLDKTEILNTGFESDRSFGIINIENVLLTAREKPRLLQIGISYIDSVLEITVPDQEPCSVDLSRVATKSIQVTLFKERVNAKLIARVVNEYLSNFLREKVRLISIDSNALRNIKEEHNGQPDDVISFSDVAPIHLVNTTSLEDLNSKLEQPLLATRFRPNIVVTGVDAYAEEDWKHIKIGECEFEVIIATERCALVNIDPVRLQKHPKQEPLRTLAKNTRGGSDKANFGVYLVPRKLGAISASDTLEVVS